MKKIVSLSLALILILSLSVIFTSCEEHVCEFKEEWASDATANPYYHLNCDDITEDLYEGGNWVEASAEISNESLVFTFCTYACYLDGDYTRVVATYTPNN